MFRKPVLLVLAIVLIFAFALPTLAQEGTEEAMPLPENAVAAGLSSPRGISVDADGNVYVAEAGSGGDSVMVTSEEFGDTTYGFTSQVTMIAADGTQSVALPFMFSAATPSEALGTQAVYMREGSLWVVVSGGGPGPQPLYGNAVLEIDPATGRIKTFIDVYAYEVNNNPDGNEPLDSNVNNIEWDANGTLYIVETGANAIYTWTPEAGLTPWHVWPDNPVPTTIRFDANGDAWVSFLGAGLAPGAAKIEHWSADGQTLIETFGGLTAVTDFQIGQDGGIYAVQLFSAFGDQGPVFDSGNVVLVTAEGATPVAEGLVLPYSIAQTHNGDWLVTVGTLAPAGAGMVLNIGGGS